MSTATLFQLWFEPPAWIDGRWCPGGKTSTVGNPATAATIETVSHADATAMTRDIEGVVRAQQSWREVSVADRNKVPRRRH